MALALVIGAGLYLSYDRDKSATTSTPGAFNSKDIGLSFTYPVNYQLDIADDEEGAVRTITLIDKANLPVGQNTEGPPAITIQRFDNPENLALDQWILTTPASNYHLSSMGEMGGSTIDGEAGLGYTYSGLYENTAIAVAHGGKIYLFVVGTLTPEDTIKSDYFTILESVKFI